MRRLDTGFHSDFRYLARYAISHLSPLPRLVCLGNLSPRSTTGLAGLSLHAGLNTLHRYRDGDLYFGKDEFVLHRYRDGDLYFGKDEFVLHRGSDGKCLAPRAAKGRPGL